MKKIFYLLMILGAISISAQQEKHQHNAPERPNKEEFIKQKEQLLIEELGIKEEQKEAFRKVFQQYQKEHQEIKEQFSPDFETEKLSDEEALKKIKQGFAVGVQLLQNRDKYTELFLKVLTPQQVLKLFQTEGKIKDKMRKKCKY